MDNYKKIIIKKLISLYSDDAKLSAINGKPINEVIDELNKLQLFFHDLDKSIYIVTDGTIKSLFSKSVKLKYKNLSYRLRELIECINNLDDYTSLYNSITYLRSNDAEEFKKRKLDYVDFLIENIDVNDLLKLKLGVHNE